MELAGRPAAGYDRSIQAVMAPVPEVHELRTDVVERRLLSALSRSLLLVLLLAVARGVAFGQDTLALSSGDAEATPSH